MKYKSYGEDENLDTGMSLELLKSTDDISSRNSNRPIINLLENQEEIYSLLNNLMKSVYGKVENAILPGIYEEFDPEGFIINSFALTNKYFLRIPTGSLLLSDSANLKDDKNYGERNYSDGFTNTLQNDKFKSFAYNNKPNISLLEKQLANIIGLDLSDLDNNIEIKEEKIPIVYPVYILDSDNLPVSNLDGNFKYLTTGDNKRLYVCYSKEDAEFFSTNINNFKRPVNYGEGASSFKPDGINASYKLDRYYTSEGSSIIDISDYNNQENAIFLTTNKSKAKKALDLAGGIKYKIGYCLKVAITNFSNIDVSYLPNKQENSNWIIKLDEDQSDATYRISLFNNLENTPPIKEYDFIKKSITENSINDELYNQLYFNFGKYFSLEKIALPGSSTKDALKIINKSPSDYKITISKKSSSGSYDPCTNLVDNNLVEKLISNNSIEQEYYDNIFELVNSFVDKYEGYLTINKNEIYKYLSLETILELSPSENNTDIYYIYYDMSFDIESNKLLNNYDYSGRLFISNKSEEEKSIKLFKIEVDNNKLLTPNAKPKINSITTYLKLLDSRAIITKYGEFKTIKAERTDFEGGIFNLNDPILNIRSKKAGPIDANEVSGTLINNYDGDKSGVIGFDKFGPRIGNYKLYYSDPNDDTKLYKDYDKYGELIDPVTEEIIPEAIKTGRVITIADKKINIWSSNDTRKIASIEDNSLDNGIAVWNEKKGYFETAGNAINMIVNQDEDPNSKLPDNNKNNEWKLIKREIGFKELK